MPLETRCHAAAAPSDCINLLCFAVRVSNKHSVTFSFGHLCLREGDLLQRALLDLQCSWQGDCMRCM